MRSFSCFLTVCGAVLATSAPGKAQTLIVALGGGEDQSERVAARRADEEKSGHVIVSTDTAIARLTGTTRSPAPTAAVDGADAAALLERAREREADFDNAGAAKLRNQILTAFDHATRPDPALRRAAGLAALELAAALRDERGDKAAAPHFATAVRRFPDQSLDPQRYAPEVLTLYETAVEKVATGPRGKLTVISESSGEVFVDGAALGRSRGTLTRTLPVGTYRVWLVDGAVVSLPHRIEISANGSVEINIDLAFERCVEIGEVIALTCEESWAANLRHVAARVGATRAIGVPQPGLAATEADRFSDGVLIGSPRDGDEATGVGASSESIPAEPLARFSPLYLIPLGGGQLAQDRLVFAATYLGTEIALLVWHIAESLAHGDAVAAGNVEAEPALRSRRYISGGLFFSLLAATVVEAVVWGLVFGE